MIGNALLKLFVFPGPPVDILLADLPVNNILVVAGNADLNIIDIDEYRPSGFKAFCLVLDLPGVKTWQRGTWFC